MNKEKMKREALRIKQMVSHYPEYLASYERGGDWTLSEFAGTIDTKISKLLKELEVEISPLHFIKEGYKCKCGGKVAVKQINYSLYEWVCTSCGEHATDDEGCYPSHFVEVLRESA